MNIVTCCALRLGEARFVSENEKVEWLRRAAVTVNTSEKEGWGMTVIEGNACGAPSVSSNVHGLRDAVRDGETGLLFPCGAVHVRHLCGAVHMRKPTRNLRGAYAEPTQPTM